jgi:Zn-finger nucleic acid-binding protein
MTERNQIEIDYCPSCRGVWLDKGELDKMLQYAAQYTEPEQRLQQQPPTANTYNPYGKHQQGYNKPYKKKSFLGDLFDFD